MIHARTHVLFALLLAIPVPVLAQVEVTGCTQTINGTDAFLSANVECLGYERVSLCNATLDLGGFTLTSLDGGIYCEPGCTCTVRGPGTINGSVRDDGLFHYKPAEYARVYVENVTMTNANGYCSVSVGGPLSVIDSTLSGCAIRGFGKVSVSGSEVTGNLGDSSAVEGERVRISDSRLAQNGYGIISRGWVILKKVTIEQNSIVGVKVTRPWRLGGKVSVYDSTIRDNVGDGILYGVTSVTLARSSITGNGRSGVAHIYDFVYGSCPPRNKFRATGTDVSANRTSASCSDPGVLCADVDSCVEPQLKDTGCEISHMTSSGIPGNDWNLCTAD